MDGYISEIRLFAANFSPVNWALCKGQLLAIAQNTSLFALIGNTYGGDGNLTFALPDLRGRAAIGAGNGAGLSPRSLGSHFGTENVILNINQIPAHNHQATMSAGKADLYTSTNPGQAETPSSNDVISADGGGTAFIYGLGPANIKMASTSIQNVSGTITTYLTGGSQHHDNMQPSLALNYIICLQGIFPSRN